MLETFLHDFLTLLGYTVLNTPLTFAALLYAMIMLTSLFHESGHALMARTLGTKVIAFVLGRPCLLSFSLGHTRFMLGPVPGGQVTYAYADDAPRWKVTIATLSGPLAELAGGIGVYLLAGDRPETWLYLAMVGMNTLCNFNPLSCRTDGHKIIKHLLAMRQGRRTLDA
ncbi:site-2 protease family protein [Brenneria uluponensis]|uniref:site-2 protease family protein n=1 Tax=Brenneria uluponensis TaxID=3057057 RepID=UPI0028E906E1|nr:site-2 protease family protein [Brenneria ulupoensis]